MRRNWGQVRRTVFTSRPDQIPNLSSQLGLCLGLFNYPVSDHLRYWWSRFDHTCSCETVTDTFFNLTTSIWRYITQGLSYIRRLELQMSFLISGSLRIPVVLWCGNETGTGLLYCQSFPLVPFFTCNKRFHLLHLTCYWRMCLLARTNIVTWKISNCITLLMTHQQKHYSLRYPATTPTHRMFGRNRKQDIYCPSKASLALVHSRSRCCRHNEAKGFTHPPVVNTDEGSGDHQGL